MREGRGAVVPAAHGRFARAGRWLRRSDSGCHASGDRRSIVVVLSCGCQVVVKPGFGESYDSEIHMIIILSPAERAVGKPLIHDNCGSGGMEDCGTDAAKCGRPWEWRIGWGGRLWEEPSRGPGPNMEARVTPRWKPMGMAAKHGSPWERAAGVATPPKGGSVWEGRATRSPILEDRGKPSARPGAGAGRATSGRACRKALTLLEFFQAVPMSARRAPSPPFPRNSVFQRRVPSPPGPTAFHLSPRPASAASHGLPHPGGEPRSLPTVFHVSRGRRRAVRHARIGDAETWKDSSTF